MSLEWMDGYKIGHDEIDSQHEELFRLANNFLNAKDKVRLTECAMGLFRYTRTHFQHEEDLMKRIGYPAIEMHLAQHTELISLLSDVANNIADESLDMQDLEFFLSAWLIGHIGSSDAKLAAYVGLRAQGIEFPATSAMPFADFQ
jgi:hemerythrin-like metal-binding protein